MLDRQRGEVGIGGEGARHARRAERSERMTRCRGPGSIGRTQGRACQPDTMAATSAPSSGARITRGCVVSRTKPRDTAQGRPTSREPLRVASHQRRAAAWCGQAESCA